MKIKIFGCVIKYKAENKFEGVGIKGWIGQNTLMLNLSFCPGKEIISLQINANISIESGGWMDR